MTDEKLLTIKEVRYMLKKRGCEKTTATITRWCHSKTFVNARQVGHIWYIPTIDVEKVINGV